MVLKLTLRCLVRMGYQCTFGVLQVGLKYVKERENSKPSISFKLYHKTEPAGVSLPFLTLNPINVPRIPLDGATLQLITYFFSREV